MSSEQSGVPTRIWVIVTILVAVISGGATVVGARSDLIPGVKTASGKPKTQTFTLRPGEFKDIEIHQWWILQAHYPSMRVTSLGLVKKEPNGPSSKLTTDYGAKIQLKNSGLCLLGGSEVVSLGDDVFIVPQAGRLSALDNRSVWGCCHYDEWAVLSQLHAENVNSHSSEVTITVFVLNAETTVVPDWAWASGGLVGGILLCLLGTFVVNRFFGSGSSVPKPSGERK